MSNCNLKLRLWFHVDKDRNVRLNKMGETLMQVWTIKLQRTGTTEKPRIRVGHRYFSPESAAEAARGFSVDGWEASPIPLADARRELASGEALEWPWTVW